MKTTTFNIINNTESNNTFCGKSTNYSKILDDLILSNIKKCNPYLSKGTTSKKESDFIDLMIAHDSNHIISDSCLLKENDKFLKAANFLANYKKKSCKKLPFIFGKTYKLIDGTPIIFYEDEIQIGLDLYNYDDFSDITIIKKLPTATKKTIINIFGGGNIEINIK